MKVSRAPCESSQQQGGEEEKEKKENQQQFKLTETSEWMFLRRTSSPNVTLRFFTAPEQKSREKNGESSWSTWPPDPHHAQSSVSRQQGNVTHAGATLEPNFQTFAKNTELKKWWVITTGRRKMWEEKKRAGISVIAEMQGLRRFFRCKHDTGWDIGKDSRRRDVCFSSCLGLNAYR